AREMALAIEQCAGVASNAAVAEWLSQIAGDTIAERASVLARVEGGKGRRVSEIRAAMLDALNLEDFDEVSSTDTIGEDEPPPSTDHTSAADTTTRAATLAKASKSKPSGWRAAFGILAVAAAA